MSEEEFLSFRVSYKTNSFITNMCKIIRIDHFSNSYFMFILVMREEVQFL